MQVVELVPSGDIDANSILSRITEWIETAATIKRDANVMDPNNFPLGDEPRKIFRVYEAFRFRLNGDLLK